METCQIQYMPGHRDSVNSLSACGQLIASGCDDGTVRVWDLRIKK
jgi:WD40 repeat protein